jgi:hypothetical protein
MEQDRYNSPGKRNLDQRLATYSAAAGATLLAFAPTADAQVQYTDIDPDEIVEGSTEAPAEFEIDFDGDGTADITLVQDNPSATFTRSRVFPGTNAIAGFGPVTTNYYYFYASFLQDGDVISSGVVMTNTNDDREDFMLASTFAGNTYGNWGGEENGDGYLGVEFEAGGGTTHYAWVRIDVAADASSMTVKDYAFQATPDTPIEAGQMMSTSSESGPLEGDFRLSAAYPNPFANDATLELEVARAQDVTVEMFDVLGRSVQVLHQGALAAGEQHEIAISGRDLPNGVYLVRAVGESFRETRTVTLAR